ncbi:TPA: hypothetical protein ACM6YU_004094, partial [Escherichia coli]
SSATNKYTCSLSQSVPVLFLKQTTPPIRPNVQQTSGSDTKWTITYQNDRPPYTSFHSLPKLPPTG